MISSLVGGTYGFWATTFLDSEEFLLLALDFSRFSLAKVMSCLSVWRMVDSYSSDFWDLWMAAWANLAVRLVSLRVDMVSRACTDLKFLATVFLGEVLLGDLELFGDFEFLGDFDFEACGDLESFWALDLKVLTTSLLGEPFLLLTETGLDFFLSASDFWWRVCRLGGSSSCFWDWAVVLADFKGDLLGDPWAAAPLVSLSGVFLGSDWSSSITGERPFPTFPAFLADCLVCFVERLASGDSDLLCPPDFLPPFWEA